MTCLSILAGICYFAAFCFFVAAKIEKIKSSLEEINNEKTHKE